MDVRHKLHRMCELARRVGEVRHARPGRPGIPSYSLYVCLITLGCLFLLTLTCLAAMISEAALGLALDDASLPLSARLGGVLTPSTALGSVLVSRLEATGRIRFESEIVRADGESRKDR